jgi:hydroxymethylpyrimidine/phosphomethylpyrimidine kinase
MPSNDQTYVLSIAGYDPCAGAGVLADVKTFEQLGVYGMSACTAITYQTEDVFSGVKWLKWNEIASQLLLLLSRYQFKAAKIGLVQDQKMLSKIISTLKAEIPQIRIVWDPVLSASAGYEFYRNWNQNSLHEILKQITILTPNWEEAKHLSNFSNGLAGAKQLALHTNIFLKGGHNNTDKAVDYLIRHTGEIIKFPPTSIDAPSKHGSGCILSAALSAFIAKGFDLEKSCRNAKEYTYQYMQSSPHLLGSHLSWNESK